MAGNTFGKHFTITTWGESHGKAIGVVVDGCPAGLALSEADIQPFLDRRHISYEPQPSKGPQDPAFFTQHSDTEDTAANDSSGSELIDITEITSKKKESGVIEKNAPSDTSSSISGETVRHESDKIVILSGVFEGKTTGAPISIMIRNEDTNSDAYLQLKDIYRPGHADFTYDAKYGFRDWRGGGRSSGRETATRVAAGAIAIKVLNKLGVTLSTETYTMFTPAEGDSIGGSCEVRVSNMPAGIGEPLFDKLDGNLARAIMSIGAVKAVEIGEGCTAASMSGSINNDEFTLTQEIEGKSNSLLLASSRKCGKHLITKNTNNAGGILGGISDGDEILIKAYFKPTPSISLPQKTIDKNGNPVEINIEGRHDVCIATKGAVVVEAMTAITILDLMFENMHSRMTDLEKFYK